jgi:uncharacterized membrane protein YfcA
MTLFEIVVLFVAGIGAGTINTVVGSGSLITFPALLAFGYPPIIANMTNNMGVLPGAVSGAVAYRDELRDQWPRVLAAVANTSAAFIFVIRGGIDWKAAGIIAAGAIIGGQLGAHIGRRLPAPIYRAVIVIVGVAAFFKLVLT